MMRSTKQSGFSMIELMVAMVVTLVVSGAIFGLLTAGHNAFRREPQLSDRQQNIRMAMDMITKDIAAAGSGMATDVQTFTINDGAALGGTPLNNPPAPGSWPSVMVPGQRADYLEMMSTDPSCPASTTCKEVGVNIDTNEQPPACYGGGQIGNSFIAYVWGPNGSAQGAGPPGVLDMFVRGGGGGCGNGHYNEPPGQNPSLNAPQPCTVAGTCAFLAMMHLIRYEIAADCDNPNFPALWRSGSGRTVAGAGPACPIVAGGAWQLVATGVEDLQVRYLTTGGGWQDSPPVIAAGNPGTWVREVQVSLSAQSIAPNLAGQTVSATGNADRGQLISTVTPRAVLLNSDAAGVWK